MTRSVKDVLLTKIEQKSESTLKELLDFLLFFEAREAQKEELEIFFLIQASLAEYWLTTEEDEEWQHL